MEAVSILVAPFFAGLSLTLLLRANTRRGALWAVLVGVGLAACAALVVGLSVPNTFPEDGGEPFFTQRVGDELLVCFILVVWLMGVGAGAALVAALAAIGRGRSVDP